MELFFLSLSEVIEIHQDQIARYGGSAGIRDLEMLKSAIGMPAATYGGKFLHTDIFEMASAYLFHIVKNHPFIDGNKRTGAVAAIVFLDLNGHEFSSTEDDLADAVIEVASGSMDKATLARLMRTWSQ